MQVNYKGISEDYNYRVAEINFTDSEAKTLERIITVMNIKGWSIDTVTDGYAVCKIDDKTEYNSFIKDWKECKISVKMWNKFGI